jgi:predicted GIY-YIG superfamily endonuclease
MTHIEIPAFLPPPIGGWRRVFIYFLLDPETRLVRYVGKTENLKARYQSHLKEKSNCHRSHWIQALARRGLKPVMQIVECIDGEHAWQESERHWIAYGKRNGWPLTNNTNGGDGVPGLPEETKARIRAASLGRKYPLEIRMEFGKAMRGKHHTEETKAKMRAVHAGRKITWIAKIAERLRKLTPEQAADVKRRLDAGERVKDIAAELGMHRTSISKVKMGTYFATL